VESFTFLIPILFFLIFFILDLIHKFAQSNIGIYMYENIIMGAGGVAQVWSTCLANRRLNPSTAKKKKKQKLNHFLF
jgi:hypothetical protein